MRVYLAGPDVFCLEPSARAAALKAVCFEHGLVGVSPLDGLPNEPAAWARLAEPHRIALRNEANIRSCDALIANLTPFRGPSADVGTVFELGFMRALGRPVFGWSMTTDCFATRTRAACAVARDASGVWRDANGMAVEDFGLGDNLMIDGAVVASGGALVVEERSERSDLDVFERCVRTVAAMLATAGGRRGAA